MDWQTVKQTCLRLAKIQHVYDKYNRETPLTSQAGPAEPSLMDSLSAFTPVRSTGAGIFLLMRVGADSLDVPTAVCPFTCTLYGLLDGVSILALVDSFF